MRIINLIKLISFLICFNSIKQVNSSTCATDLEKCTSAVNPLLKNVAYMFPSTKEEVIKMCSIWGSIVECVRHYIKKCLNQTHKKTFNFAVGNSIGTVHSICVADEVQKQYLANAACLRDVSVKNCELYFNQLVDVVTNPKAKDNHICCAYTRFRKCVDRPLVMQCGELFRNLMDHSLTFLIRKCHSDGTSNNYENCQLNNLELASISSPSQRKLDDHLASNRFEANNGFYPINHPTQLTNPYLAKKQDANYQASSEETETNSDSATVNREAKSVDKNLDDVDNEFQLNNQATRFNRQDDEFETDKHRDFTTESPEYMMSHMHLSPEELHNHCSNLIVNHYLIIHLLLAFYAIRSVF